MVRCWQSVCTLVSEGCIFFIVQSDTLIFFMFRGVAEIEGDYQFCLDNSFSRFARKLAFFELITEDEEEEDDINAPDLPVDETLYDMKMEDMKVCSCWIRI